MKLYLRAILVALFLSVYVKSNAQTPSWLWAKSAGGTSSEGGLSIATDAVDNIYVTGVFQSASITFGSTTLTNAGSNDIFVVKYDVAGNVVWAYGGGGAGVDYGYGISTDINRNVYVAGIFTSTITFGSTTLTTAGASDIFIAKFDSSGNVLWAEQAGGTNFDYCYKITADANGNTYISGHFSSDTISFGNITLINSTFDNMFLAKYDSSGNAIWARSDGSDSFAGIRADNAGNIYLSGSFYNSTITFGSTVLTNADASGNTADLFIVKYDTAGNVIWAKEAGGTDDEGASSIDLDGNSNICITGYFTSSNLAFGSTILNCGSAYGDIFIAKYDSAGNPLWANQAGGTYNQQGTGIGTDGNNNVYVTGKFQSATCSFGSITLTNAGGAGGEEDVFVAKYDAAGNILWAMGAGGVLQDVSWDICTNAIGNAFITGYFWSTSISFGGTTLSNAGTGFSGDIFVAKLDYATDRIELSNYNDEVRIFPTPANNYFTIALGSINKKVKVLITDVTGKIIYTTTATEAHQIQVNIKDFTEGIYTVQIQSADFIETKKLIVEK